MDRGIWAIEYEIACENASEYLDWFHRVHIPEKLSRPGYLWAAHYEIAPKAGGMGGDADKSYLALFGGATAHVFFNPSPGQLLLRQSAETKRMMGMRIRPSASILAEEIRVDGPAAAQRGPGLTAGPVVQMGNYNAASPAAEDDLGAWYAQERLPLLAALPGCIGARKMLAAAGACKHAILHEFISPEAREQHFVPQEADAHDPGTWMGRVRPQLTHAPRSPLVGRRLWPATES
jgi:hypothetical protein